jgi:hypothetical protein
MLEVLAVGEHGAPPPGTSDPDILRWIEASRHILVTENRRTIPGHLSAHFAAGRHIPGLLWIRPGAALPEVVETLYLIAEASSSDEYTDRALFIPL